MSIDLAFIGDETHRRLLQEILDRARRDDEVIGVLLTGSVAREAGDLLQAAYVASTTSWKILEGLWAANDRPMPAGSAVRAHIQDLSQRPPALEALWRRLFAGDAPNRVQAAIEIIEWVIPRLDPAFLQRLFGISRDVGAGFVPAQGDHGSLRLGYTAVHCRFAPTYWGIPPQIPESLCKEGVSSQKDIKKRKEGNNGIQDPGTRI